MHAHTYISTHINIYTHTYTYIYIHTPRSRLPIPPRPNNGALYPAGPGGHARRARGPKPRGGAPGSPPEDGRDEARPRGRSSAEPSRSRAHPPAPAPQPPGRCDPHRDPGSATSAPAKRRPEAPGALCGTHHGRWWGEVGTAGSRPAAGKSRPPRARRCLRRSLGGSTRTRSGSTYLLPRSGRRARC